MSTVVGELVLVVVTAVLSSLCTLGAAWWLFERRLRPRLQGEIDRRVAELGVIVEERVRKGTLEAVAAIPSTEVLRDTTRTMTRTGMSFLEALLGGRKRGDERGD